MFGRHYRAWLIALGVLTLLCVLVTALYVFDAVYVQWSQSVGWASVLNPHSETVFLLYTAWLGSLILLIAVVVSWVTNLKHRFYSQRLFVIWIAVLTASTSSYFPSTRAYAALAVLLLGPGVNSVRLQRDAAMWDSVALLDSLMKRGARIEDTLLVFASRNNSPSVISRLIQKGMQVNEHHYPSRITALHNAVGGKQYGIAELLLEAGADANIPDAKGVTPIDLATNMKDEKMLHILKREKTGKQTP